LTNEGWLTIIFLIESNSKAIKRRSIRRQTFAEREPLVRGSRKPVEEAVFLDSQLCGGN